MYGTRIRRETDHKSICEFVFLRGIGVCESEKKSEKNTTRYHRMKQALNKALRGCTVLSLEQAVAAPLGMYSV